MACAPGNLSCPGLNVVGGIVGGDGLANAGPSVSNIISNSGISGLALSAATLAESVSVETITEGFTQITEGTADLVKTIGNSVGNGALTGMVGNTFSSVLGSGSNFSTVLNAHTAELFGNGPLQVVQTLDSVQAFADTSLSIAVPLLDGIATQYGQAVAALQQTLPLNNLGEVTDIGKYLGKAIPDLTAALTNGMSSLVNEITFLPTLGEELINLGDAFDIQDIVNFGNPGQLIKSIYEAGAEGITGIQPALATVGINPAEILNFTSSEYNDILNDVLSSITDSQLIENAQAILGSSINGLSSMADFTNLKTVLPVSFDQIPFDNFQELAEGLANIERGALQTPQQLGKLLIALETLQLTSLTDGINNVIDPDAFSNLSSTFLGGSGQDGSITVIDIMGSVGGVGILDQSQKYSNAINLIDSEGYMDDLRDRYDELERGIAGEYLDDPDPMIATEIVDPYDSTSYGSLEDFVIAKVAQIEAEVAAIKANSDISTVIADAESAWAAMQKKISDEKVFASRTDLHLDQRNSNPENAFYFVSQASRRANDMTISPVIEGMARTAQQGNDKFGEYTLALMIEERNKAVVDTREIRWMNQYQG